MVADSAVDEKEGSLSSNLDLLDSRKADGVFPWENLLAELQEI